MISLSIIYVYYYSSPFIEKSIKSVIKNVLNIDYEIIVVINGGNEKLIEKIPHLSKRIKLIESEKNLGFGQGNNIGKKYANGKYLLLLNPDIIITSKNINQLFNQMVENKNVGLLICKLITEKGNIQKNVIYKNYNLLIICLELFFLHRLFFFKRFFYSDEDYSLIQSPKVVSGAFMLFSREIFSQINGFDESFFMYGEDKDICLRTFAISKILYYPKVSVLHIGDSSLGVYPSKKKLFMMYSSQLKNTFKNFGYYQYLILRIIYFINALLFFPFSFFIKNKTHKSLLFNRSIVLLKLFFSFKR